jgi:hypothetical protein
MQADPNARLEFVQAHVRRLEALRRAGHASRHPDGRWSLPADYLQRAGAYERASANSRPVKIEIRSRLSLARMTTAMGATWLDEDLREFSDREEASGFGMEVEQARQARRQFLVKHGLLEEGTTRLDDRTLAQLEIRDLNEAGRALSEELGKPYVQATQSGRISGIYTKVIDLPSGRYAVIERAKDFTLVPWREVMDRNLGKAISGTVRGQGISWGVTKGRGI